MSTEGGVSASSASASASASPAAVLAAANAHAAAALGASPASLALSGVQPPPASSLAAAVPKDARNEFVFAYGLGSTTLPWGARFGDRVAADADDGIEARRRGHPDARQQHGRGSSRWLRPRQHV